MKKTFIYSLTIFLFIAGIAILSTHKLEAAITAYINATSTSVKVGDPSVGISFGSDGASSCTVTLNGSVVSTSYSGNLSLGTSTPGTYTYRINCQKVWPTTTSCFGGFYENPDPVHPDGGVINYTNPNGTPGYRSGIWIDDAVYIEYRTANGYSIVGGAKGAGACL